MITYCKFNNSIQQPIRPHHRVNLLYNFKNNCYNKCSFKQSQDKFVKTSEVEEIQRVDTMPNSKHDLDHYEGCLLGGAIGDAMGGSIEFLNRKEIKDRYGKNGLEKLILNEAGIAEITDDTQLTLFTADGLIKAYTEENELPEMKKIYDSYKNWYQMQISGKKLEKGWISQISELCDRRVPGATCKAALKQGVIGTIEKPINNSDGSGGLMRVSPVGLLYYKNQELAFEIGSKCAALTHGHPDAYLSAGVYSAIIANIIQGKSLEKAVDDSIEILNKYDGSENLRTKLYLAKFYSKKIKSPQDAIKLLDEGSHSSRALAISIFCALTCEKSYKNAILTATNYSTSKDTTAALTGSILGSYLGKNAIPQDFIKNVELSSELQLVAKDLFKPDNIKNKEKRYPTDIVSVEDIFSNYIGDVRKQLEITDKKQTLTKVLAKMVDLKDENTKINKLSILSDCNQFFYSTFEKKDLLSAVDILMQIACINSSNTQIQDLCFMSCKNIIKSNISSQYIHFLKKNIGHDATVDEFISHTVNILEML